MSKRFFDKKISGLNFQSGCKLEKFFQTQHGEFSIFKGIVGAGIPLKPKPFGERLEAVRTRSGFSIGLKYSETKESNGM